MGSVRLVRILLACGLATAASVSTMALAVPAGAVDYTTCSSLSGVNLSGQTESIGGCTGPTGGSGVFAGPVSSPITITWADGGTTTVSFKVKTHKKSKCAIGSTEMSLTGHATASTGPAQQIRGMFYATICTDPNGNLNLLPGKLMLLQT